MFPTLTTVVPVMMLFAHAVVATFLVFALVLAHAVMFSMTLAHAHAMVVGLNLLMFFC